jgi:RNA polymerase sigma-70 factor (ECF subfamily)
MESATSTLGLIDRLKQGDQEAFSLLFEKYCRRLAVLIHYRLSQSMRRTAEVDDVLQEVFLRALNGVGQFTYQGPGSFMRWLSRIADHVITDIARSETRQKRHADEIVHFRSESNPGGPEPADTKTPSRVLWEKEKLLALLEKLNMLPQEYRQVILLAKIEGLSTQEVAQQLGKSRDATALLLHRAIKRFRNLQDKSTATEEK